MAKLGRNARCHCGSGKKYKKCCLQGNERPAGPRHPPPATARERASPDDLVEGINRILQSDNRQQAWWLAGAALCQALGLDPAALHDDHVGPALMMLTRFGPAAVADVEAYQRSLGKAHAGDPLCSWLITTLGRRPPEVWRVTHSATGHDVRVSPLQDRARRSVSVDGVIGIGPPLDNRLILGWLIERQGGRQLLRIFEPDPAMAKACPLQAPVDPDWLENLSTLLDPDQQFAHEDLWDDLWEEDDSPDEYDYTRSSGYRDTIRRYALRTAMEQLTRGLLWGTGPAVTVEHSLLGKRTPRSARSLAALAESPEQWQLLERAVGALRLQAVGSQGRIWPDNEVPLEELDKHCSAAEILEAAGVPRDGTVPGFDPAALERLPVGLLLLPADHLLFRVEGPGSQIASAIAWARRAPDRGAARDVEAAVAQLRVERRWEALGALVPARRARYGRLDGLNHVFDPRLAAKSLDALGLTKAQLNRTRRAVQCATGGAVGHATHVADLPDLLELLEAPGFGMGTATALTTALENLMDGWREQLAGDIGRLTAVQGEARETIQEGLDELAALFGVEAT